MEHAGHMLRCVGTGKPCISNGGVGAGARAMQLQVLLRSARTRARAVVERGWLMSLGAVPASAVMPRVLQRKWMSFGFASTAVIMPVVCRNWRRSVPAGVPVLSWTICWKVLSST